jgi:heptaprenyl diphosphate synthase
LRGGKTFKMVYMALLVAFAVAVHTVEAAIPVPIPVPGAKLGLANIITLLAIVFYGCRSGLIVASLRSIVGSLIIGNFMGFGFYLSFSGAVASSLMMSLFMYPYNRRKVSLISVSLAGAVTFNIVQLALAAALVQNFVLFRGYLPLLLLLAVPTGFFTGLAAIFLEKTAGHAGLGIDRSLNISGNIGARSGKATGFWG